MSYLEIKRASDRLVYLLAVEKYEGTDVIARALARFVLDSWGREYCPITGHQFFWVCCEDGTRDAEDWKTLAKVSTT